MLTVDCVVPQDPPRLDLAAPQLPVDTGPAERLVQAVDSTRCTDVDVMHYREPPQAEFEAGADQDGPRLLRSFPERPRTEVDQVSKHFPGHTQVVTRQVTRLDIGSQVREDRDTLTKACV
jgi:hypothetical protein